MLVLPILLTLLGVLIVYVATNPVTETWAIVALAVVAILIVINVVTTCKAEFARRKKEKEETRQ